MHENRFDHLFNNPYYAMSFLWALAPPEEHQIIQDHARLFSTAGTYIS
jgi:hypothetical protein